MRLGMVMEMMIERDSSRRAVLNPSPFPPNLSLVLRFTVISLISLNVVIVLDKAASSLIPSIIILSTIIVLDKAILYNP